MSKYYIKYLLCTMATMIIENEKQTMLKLLYKGYVLPMSMYSHQSIQDMLSSTFLIDGKPVKIIKDYKIELEDVLSATLDSRFKI